MHTPRSRFSACYFFLVSLFLFPDGISAQKQNANWRFGFNAGLTFTNNAVNSVTTSALVSGEGCASISDSLGNLLFYTNGFTVWNRLNLVMQNGDSLNGNPSCTQAALICPKPCNDKIYYLFTNDAFENNNLTGLCYSEVNMNLANGLGGITATKTVNLVAPTAEKLTGTLHSNQKDYWVVTHGRDSNIFYSYLVTSAGVNTTAVVSSVGSVFDSLNAINLVVGQMKISYTGQKLAMATQNYSVELFDFNPTTGVVSNPVLVSDSGAYGVEFSKSGRFLYTSVDAKRKIYQYDLTAPNIAQSKTVIGTIVSPQVPGALQLAPNGKIYGAKSLATDLTVINSPDLLGALCSFSATGPSLNNKTAVFSLPNFILKYGGKCAATSLETNENRASGFEIFPNPCNDVLFLKLKETTGRVDINILDNMGSVVRTLTAESQDGLIQLDTKDLMDGIYVVDAGVNGTIPARAKLVVNKRFQR